MKDFPNLGLDVYDIYDIFDRNIKEVFNVSLINCDDVEDGLYDDYLFDECDEYALDERVNRVHVGLTKEEEALSGKEKRRIRKCHRQSADSSPGPVKES